MNVFTRSLSDNLARLVKEVDEVVGKNEEQKMAAFVVLLTDDPDAAESELKAFAEQHKIKKCATHHFRRYCGSAQTTKSRKMPKSLSCYGEKKKVKSNHAFAEGKLDRSGIAEIIKDTGKILN